LHGGIDCDGVKARDGGPFVEEVAANDTPIQLRNNGIKPGMCQSLHHPIHRDLGRRIARREVVLCRNSLEGFVADGAANRSVFKLAWSEREWHRMLSS
jgi:hypothetical protein